MINTAKILILGLGSMGSYLAHRLSKEGHEVTAIDSNRKKLQEVDSDLDARLIEGDALDFARWKDAEIERMDYLIAVTNDDAVNLMACIAAHSVGVRNKVARSRAVDAWSENSPLRSAAVPVDLVIRPGELAAQEIVRLVKMQSSNLAISVGDGELQTIAVDVTPSSPLCGQSVAALGTRFKDVDLRVGCVTRDIETMIPSGDLVFEPGDRAFVITRTRDSRRLHEFLRFDRSAQHDVLIVGGGLVGSRVAELLQDEFRISLLDHSLGRAEELTHRLSSTRCLHGDGSSRTTLLQAGLLSADTVVTATGDDEQNVMVSLLAQHLIATRADKHEKKARRTIALLDREEYLVLAPNLGTDMAVSRKILAANQILRHIRKGQVLSVAHLHGCAAEVVELVAQPGSPITKRPLQHQSDLRGRVTIGAVMRKSGWEVAVGSTQVRSGQRVTCICLENELGALQRLFLS